MTNHEFILSLLKDGQKHCSDEILFRDYRARVGELRRGKNKWHKRFSLVGEVCKGRCGRTHQSDVYWLWWDNPKEVADVFAPVKAPEASQDAPGRGFASQIAYTPPSMSTGHISRNYAYYPPPEPTFCCPIAKVSGGRIHTRGCEAQKEPV